MTWLDPLRGSRVLADARAALESGRLEVSAALGPAGLALAALVTEAPLLVVVPRERDVERTTDDLRALCTEAGGKGAVLPFPAPGPPPFRGLPRHPDASLRRATALLTARAGSLRALVASPAGLLRPVLAPHLLETRVVSLRVGEEMTPEILLEALEEGGYRREDPVTGRGQVARRGGILDIFPPDHDAPVRLEFLGDTLESLRRFDPETQRTVSSLETLTLLPLSDIFPTRSTLHALRTRAVERFSETREVRAFIEALDRGLLPEDTIEILPLVAQATVAPHEHLPAAVTVMTGPEEIETEVQAFFARAHEDYVRRSSGRGLGLVLPPEEGLVSPDALVARLARSPTIGLRDVDPEGRGLALGARPPARYAGDVRRLSGDLKTATGRTVLLLGSAGRAERLRDVLREDGLAVGEGQPVETRVLGLSTGFELPEVGLTVLADGDIFPEEVHLHPRGRRGAARSFLSDFRDLAIGDLVVHEEHGIGRYEGLETIELMGTAREFMVLSYQGGDRLKVPVEAFDRVQKYASAEARRPALDRLGSGSWDKVKKRVKKAMRDMAAELLKLYAERKARPGHAFTGESPWQREFEEAFEYEETPDQAQAIAEVAADMAKDTPMDRLICGDVGYGKTEVAMRAAMRAVLDGKQVALLSPTTVLALQHWKTFRKRFAPFPVKVEMVSRFRSAKEIRAVLHALGEGSVDILIGTHRLLSKDVVFRDLGLLVVDEEQRFGVAAKERLKAMRTTVDCLTLSATPIPRTLQMGLAGIRDMSVIETPPKDRLSIQTSIVKFSTDVIAAAVKQEILRDGQVYFVHNRVESIYSLANLVQRLVPEAVVAVAHGQMPEAELEKVMLAFVEGRANVLVATTIIENGLDIPRANTLLVNRADRYGLAQLYQLRGRVGRSDRRAYAYLLVPPDTVLSEIARKRLGAIREFSDLGAGFRIAALDLELRGAGNLLGGEQSGHIQAVGLDLYVKLLEQTIQELQGEAPSSGPRASLNLGLGLRIPAEYVPDSHQRMALYKRLSQVKNAQAVDALREEIKDRYGALPPEVGDLVAYAGLRPRAEALGIQQVDAPGGRALEVRFGAAPALSSEGLLEVVRDLPGSLVRPQGLRAPLTGHEGVLGGLDRLLTRIEQAAARAL